MSRLRAEVTVDADDITAAQALTQLGSLGNGWLGKPHARVSGDNLKLRLPGSSHHAPPLFRASVHSNGAGVRVAGEAVETGARIFAVLMFGLLTVGSAVHGAITWAANPDRWWVGPCFALASAGMTWWMQGLRNPLFRADVERLRETVQAALEPR